jgi:thiamine-phosphate pyrophosphorylase
VTRDALPRLHAITDERVARRDDLAAVARKLARDATSPIAFHARGRLLSGREHFELARRLPRPLFVNDRLDIALATSAAGVQLGHDSLSVAAARRLGPHWWIGRAVHDLPAARAALAAGADYLVVGPVFPTATHPGLKPLGIDGFAAFAQLGKPAIAIGGITSQRAPEVAAAGGYGVAAIRALWDAEDPGATARAMLEAFV